MKQIHQHQLFYKLGCFRARGKIGDCYESVYLGKFTHKNVL
jgi:hypothetical protein